MRLLRSAAVVIAVTLQRLAEGVTGGWSAEEHLVLAALRRSSRELEVATDSELGEYIRSLSPEQLQGVASNVKGIFHELLFEHAENIDGDEVSAQIFEATNHPGADVEFTVDGNVIEAVQLKAVASPETILEHFVRYPDIQVYATSEVAAEMAQVKDSGFSNADLTNQVNEVFDDLSGDSLGEEIGEAVAASSLVSSALLAHRVLTKRGMTREEFASVLGDIGVGAVAATSIDALISIVS